MSWLLRVFVAAPAPLSHLYCSYPASDGSSSMARAGVTARTGCLWPQVWINAHGVHAINHLAPYGGVKQSGIGRKSRIRRNSRVHAEPDHHDA